MSKKKPKPTPKLDATVENVENRIKLAVPEYINPVGSFNRAAVIGMHVIIQKRTLNTSGTGYELQEIEGIVSDMGEHYVRLRTGEKFKTIPWWSIHGWEAEEIEDGVGAEV